MIERILSKFRPARGAASGPTTNHLVVDLDRMIMEPVPCRFQGKIFYIKPVSVEEFLVISEKLADLDALKAQKKISGQQLVDAYANLINVSCTGISRKEVMKFSQAQCGAMLTAIMDHMSGKVFNEKKTQLSRLTAQQGPEPQEGPPEN